MSAWDHLARIFSASPELLQAIRCAGYAALLAAAGIFLWGLAKFIEAFRPRK